MLERIVHRLLKRRHFWRNATFGEVAELYTSRLLTLFAFRFVMTFGSVYLYKIGFDLMFIALFWVAYYAAKTIFAWPGALIAARFGPKHGVLIANGVWAVSMPLLSLVPVAGPWVLVPWIIFTAFAGSVNNLCFNIDFSKVKHQDHAGKEIGYMNIIEKVSSGLSPVIGGVIATIAGPAVTIIIASICFALSALPLFFTREPTRLHQKLQFNDFPWQLARRSLVAHLGNGVDMFANATGWSLFIAVVIFANDGNEIYAKIGAFLSLSVVIVIIVSYVYGRLIDHRQGRLLLRASVIVAALTNLFRPTVTSATGVIANSIVSDSATTGVNMAFTRGMFDLADRSGHRIVYLYLMEVAQNFGMLISTLVFTICIACFSGTSGFSIYFVVVAGLILLIATARFPLYKH